MLIFVGVRGGETMSVRVNERHLHHTNSQWHELILRKHLAQCVLPINVELKHQNREICFEKAFFFSLSFFFVSSDVTCLISELCR